MNSHWKVTSSIIAVIFLICVVLPFTYSGVPEFFTTTYNGIVQVSSLVYIGGSFLVFLWFSRKYRDDDDEFLLDVAQMRKMTESFRSCAEQEDQESKVAYLLRLLKEESGALPYDKVVRPIQEGLGAEAISLLCRRFVEISTKRSIYMSRYWAQVAATMPLLGMTGTIAGLLFMFSGDDPAADKSSQLAGLGVALLTTLYASLLTVLWAKPLAKQHADEVDELANFGKNLNNFGQTLAIQISPHDFEAAEQQSELDDGA